MASIEILIDRVGNVFNVGDTVRGVVVITCKGSTSHNGIVLRADGSVSLQLSPKAVGIFEAFYNSIKPLQLLQLEIPLVPAGKFPDGRTEVPFEFDLLEKEGSVGLFETYHGVFINVQFQISVDMQRGVFAKNVTESLNFSVRNPGQAAKDLRCEPLTFQLEPHSLKNVKKSNLQHVPEFRISGQLDSYMCDISRPLTGFVRVEHCSQSLKSIELQLVRVEFCAAQEGVAKEATEIQNIQIAEGNVARGLDVPVFMIFPRWFTCPTLVANNFKVEFEVNLVILLEDNHQITENFPIKLYRRRDDRDFLSGGEG